MELAFLLRSVGTEVCWITNKRPLQKKAVIYSLENKMLHRGVQVMQNFIMSNSLHLNWVGASKDLIIFCLLWGIIMCYYFFIFGI